MTPNYYDSELRQLADTYQHGLTLDVSRLKSAIAGASEASIIGVGSGGSYTAASLLCNLHEKYTGRVSRPVTPLEVICNPTLAASSPVFLISAEGKNPDIAEALKRARRHSARTVHVITNRETTPLTKCVNELTDVSAYIFNLEKKDGYLATNSLLLDSVVIARAYSELDQNNEKLPARLEQLSIGEQSLDGWIKGARDFVSQLLTRGAITVIYSPQLRPIAEDLESKLSEAALLHCQLADIRSYAHGRHLWLAQRPDECAILVLTDPSLDELWLRTATLFPKSIPTYTLPLNSTSPRDLIAGLVAQMHLVGEIARAAGKDPGKPEVPQFGRNLYYIDLPAAIPPPTDELDGPEISKSEVLGARWPSVLGSGAMRREKEEYCEALSKQKFRAIVFDYDGTLCSSQRKEGPPPRSILDHIERLVRAGVIVGIASGRGDSIQEKLQESFASSPDILDQLQLGLYNGGWIASAAEQLSIPKENSEFLSHVTRIVIRLRDLGAPIQHVKTTHPYQVSIRFREGLSTEQMWFVLADSLRQAGLDLSSMVRSKHSIDVLARGISKSRLIAHIIQHNKINPQTILTMGDQGAWPGNDVALLEHKYSLSVDIPSRRLDRGWKLAPAHMRDVDATLWYLDHIKISPGENCFQVAVPQ